MNKSNIVDFPSSKGPTPEEVAAQNLRGREERIDQLRSALSEKRKMGGENQILVAQALYDLLDRIEQQHRIPKAKILREAGIGGTGDSTKHLSQYAIPRDLPLEEIQRRSTRLRKGTEPYKNIARAASRLAGLPEGDVLLEVFEQANFSLEGAREAAPEFAQLASRLRFVADGISKKYDLTKFFRDVERAQAWPVPTPESVQRDAEKNPLIGDEVAIEYNWWGDLPSSVGWPIELHQLTWLTENEDFGNLPPYPSIVLGAWRIGSPFPISITRSLTETKTEIQSEAKTPVAAQGWPAVVLRLCIAPIGKEQSATPVLRIDLWAHIVGPDWTTHWAPLRRGKVTVGEYELSIEHAPKLPPPFMPLDAERHSSMGGSNLYLRIDGTACQDWFHFPVLHSCYNAKEWSLADRALGYSLCEGAEPLLFSPFESDILAAVVDAALCDPTAGLDLLLEQQVKRLTNAFKTARTAARESRDKGWEVVKEKWE